MPLFSVIVRTRDRAWFLARSLQSIGAQSVRPLEVIVVNDGGATDIVENAIARHRADGLAFVALHHERPRGIGGAWNAGIRAATGDWIATLDDDDTWAPDFLAAAAGAIQSPPLGAAPHFGIATHTNLVSEQPDGDGWRQCGTQPFNAGLQRVRLRDLVLANRFTTNAFVFPRAACDVIGYSREDLPVFDDWDFNVRFAARFPIVLLPRLLANYHRRDSVRAGPAQNSTRDMRDDVAHALRESWLRDDLTSGKFGLGALSLLAEIESNRGLRLFNKIAAWFGR